MNIAVYYRVSTKGQDKDDTYGLAKQRADVMKFVEKNGHTVVETFTDSGYSGTTLKRPALDRMLAATGFDAVVVPSWDRLARDIKIDGYLHVRFELRGLKVLSATQGTVIDPTTLFTRNILASVAMLERDLITQWLAAGRRAKAANGGYAHGKPRFGTQAIDKALATNDAEAEAIAAMVPMRDNGMTIRAIAAAMNQTTHTTRTGKPWQPSSVHRILARIPK